MFNRLVIICFFLFTNYSYAEKNLTFTKFKVLLDKEVPSILKKNNAPGISIAIVEGQNLIGIFSYGVADIQNKQPISEETLFNVGSISKVVTSWGVMKLVADGKIELDEPINKYLIRWKIPKSSFNADKVTLRNILTHTSGLSLGPYNGWDTSDDLPTIVESLQGNNTGDGVVKLIHEPNTKWLYSGGGYSVVQLLIEDVSGVSFAKFMTDNILSPLGMKNSSFEISSVNAAKLAKPHDKNGKETTMVYFVETAAAGLLTTTSDLAKFNQAVLRDAKGAFIGSNLLSTSLIEEMVKPAPHTGGRWSMSYVVDSENKSLGFAGFNRGWTSLTRSITDKNIGYVILNNSSVGAANNEVDNVLLSSIREN